jgi:hypothetical protein
MFDSASLHLSSGSQGRSGELARLSPRFPPPNKKTAVKFICFMNLADEVYHTITLVECEGL